MLVFAGKVHNLRHLGFGNLIRAAGGVNLSWTTQAADELIGDEIERSMAEAQWFAKR
jgi:hypothetical protein